MLNELAPRSPQGCGVVVVGLRGPALQNFRLDDFLMVNRTLAEYREILRLRVNELVAEVDPGTVKSLEWLRDELWRLGLQAAAKHIHKALDLLDEPTSHYSVVVHCLDESVLSIDHQVRREWTYHYGPHTPNISNFEYRWEKVLKAFPSARFEIQCALDLFALQHYTASVFHFMRLAEHGLRVLAIELAVSLPKGKPLSHANWQDIIDHCDKQVKAVMHAVPAGPNKDAALAFYSGALAHLHHLKNKFRNDVMHARTIFDLDQAADASHVAKALMELLASRLSERPKKKGFKNGKIDWGF